MTLRWSLKCAPVGIGPFEAASVAEYFTRRETQTDEINL